MKYLVLEYMKNINFASYDLNRGHMANDAIVYDASTSRRYDSYDAYLDVNEKKLREFTFEVLRCDDFDDIAIVLAKVKRGDSVIAHYIGYFKSDETLIHRIDEYWCYPAS